MKKCPLRAYSGIGGEKMGKCIQNGNPDVAAEEGCAWYIDDQCSIPIIASVFLNGFNLERMSKHGDYQAVPLMPPDETVRPEIEYRDIAADGEARAKKRTVHFTPPVTEADVRHQAGIDDDITAQAIREEIESGMLPEEADEGVVEDPPEPDPVTDALVEDGESEVDDDAK
jgi:hypothetical protein